MGKSRRFLCRDSSYRNKHFLTRFPTLQAGLLAALCFCPSRDFQLPDSCPWLLDNRSSALLISVFLFRFAPPLPSDPLIALLVFCCLSDSASMCASKPLLRPRAASEAALVPDTLLGNLTLRSKKAFHHARQEKVPSRRCPDNVPFPLSFVSIIRLDFVPGAAPSSFFRTTKLETSPGPPSTNVFATRRPFPALRPCRHVIFFHLSLQPSFGLYDSFPACISELGQFLSPFSRAILTLQGPFLSTFFPSAVSDRGRYATTDVLTLRAVKRASSSTFFFFSDARPPVLILRQE